MQLPLGESAGMHQEDGGVIRASASHSFQAGAGLYTCLRRLRGCPFARCAFVCETGHIKALLRPAVMMALVATVRRLAVAVLALVLLSVVQFARCTVASKECSSFGPRVDCGRSLSQLACLLLVQNLLDTASSVLAQLRSQAPTSASRTVCTGSWFIPYLELGGYSCDAAPASACRLHGHTARGVHGKGVLLAAGGARSSAGGGPAVVLLPQHWAQRVSAERR